MPNPDTVLYVVPTETYDEWTNTQQAQNVLNRFYEDGTYFEYPDSEEWLIAQFEQLEERHMLQWGIIPIHTSN